MGKEEGRNQRPQTQLEPVLGGVGFVKQEGGEEEPKEVWGTRLAMTVVEGGANPNNILEGGRPCTQPSSSPGRSPKFSKILETEE